MQNYHILERIGEGSFGKVYRGRRKYSGHIVALKFVSKRGKTEKNMWNLRQEISILRRLNHSNIIAMLDSFETEGEFCMVTEYAQGELFQILEDDQQLPEDEIKKIAIQLLQALHYLHTNRIIHRDMKPQNILVGPKQQIKLCDFGFARAISADTNVLTSIKGTPLYMAPELVKEQPYNHTVDLWSLGVILYELAVGRPPFYTDKIVTLIQLIVKENVMYPPTMSDELKSFLSGLLQKDPTKRMTWPEILAHPFASETAVQQQDRLALERQVRRIPSFFDIANPMDSTLQRSIDWKPVDPQTGQIVPISNQKGHDELRNATQANVEDLLSIWKAYEAQVVGNSQVANMLDSPNFVVNVNRALKCRDGACIRSALYVVHRVVHHTSKSISEVPSSQIELVRQVRSLLLEHIHVVLSSCREGVLQMVRTLMLPLPGDYQSTILDTILLLIQEATTPADVPLLSKVVKWLGITLDSSATAAAVYDDVCNHTPGLIPKICSLLDHEDSSIGSYAVFALSALVHPNGDFWNVSVSFPATMALQQEYSTDSKLDALRTAYSLRVKVHTELSNSLFKVGLESLLSKVTAEIDQCSDRDYDDDEDSHTMLTSLLKVLFYTCRVSSPLSKRTANTTKLLSPEVFHHLNSIEMYFALELLTVCQRRGVLSAASAPGLFASVMQNHHSALVQSAACNLLAESIEVDEDGVVAAEAVKYLPLLSLAVEYSTASDNILCCFGIRATGILDSLVIVLFRVASKLTEHSETDLLQALIFQFDNQGLWATFSALLQNGGRDALSPWGLFCLLKFLREVTEHAMESDSLEPAQIDRQAELYARLVGLLRPQHVQYLLLWPDVVGGGLQAVKAMIHAIVKTIGLPFMSLVVSEELLFRTQETLYDSGCVALLVNILSQQAMEMELVVKFLSRLVTSSPHFASQFVEAHGLTLLKSQGLLNLTTTPLLAEDALVLLSHVARSSRSHSPRIESADVFCELRDLLFSKDPVLRAKASNCLGNLCRHSNYFYDHVAQPLPPSQTSLIDGLLICVQDSDTLTRRYACFAIGNAAFHTDQLSRALQPAIPFLVQHLLDGDAKTRSNAAAALGNLVRQSATCCSDLAMHNAPYSLMECALDETDLGTRRIALFSLGNLCEYDICRQSLAKSDGLFAHSLQGLSDDSTDELVQKYIRRILSKWQPLP
ncbi:unnamed protein product [Aphanomyces euteiches]